MWPTNVNVRLRSQYPTNELIKNKCQQFYQCQGRGWNKQYVHGKSNDALLETCACCGYRTFQYTKDDKFTTFTLDQLDILRLNDTQVNATPRAFVLPSTSFLRLLYQKQTHLQRMSSDKYNQFLPSDETGRKKKFVQIWKLHSIYPQIEDQANYWHLHPEFVTATDGTGIMEQRSCNEMVENVHECTPVDPTKLQVK